MNPFFIMLVLIGCFLLWLVASFLYKPIGRFFYRLIKDADDAMNEVDEISTKENKTETKEN